MNNRVDRHFVPVVMWGSLQPNSVKIYHLSFLFNSWMWGGGHNWRNTPLNGQNMGNKSFV